MSLARIGLVLLAGCADGADTGAPESVGHLVAGSPVACADPAAREEMPFERMELPDEFVADEPPDIGQYDGGGLAVADFDGDGLLDVFLPNTGRDQLYFGAAGATLLNADDRLPAEALDDDRSTGASTADVDGDGDADLFIADQGGDPEIWLNEGGSFVVGEVGLVGREWHGVVGSFGDYDGDGWLDLFVSNHYEGKELGQSIVDGVMPAGHPDQLYHNLGNSSFEDVSSLLPPQLLGPSYSFAAGWYDIDGDDVLELYVVNDFGGLAVPNQMLRQTPDGFVAYDVSYGFDVGIFGMGLGVGDLNDDGLPDFAMPSWDQLVMLESVGGKWFDVAQTVGYVRSSEDRHVAWGTLLADYDNDGDLDSSVQFGQLQMPDEIRAKLEAIGLVDPLEQRDSLFLQGDDGTFSDASDDWGIADPGVGRGALAVDLDRDGWLDLIKRDVLGTTNIYHARCGSESWLEVGFSSQAVGARVEVTANGQTYRRWVGAGSEGFASGGPMEAHFGLANADKVDIRVHWPDGADGYFYNVDANQRVVASRD